MNKPKRPCSNLYSMFECELRDYIEALEDYIVCLEKEAATGSFSVSNPMHYTKRTTKIPLEDWPDHWPKKPEPPPNRIINEGFNINESIRKFKAWYKRWL